VARAREIPGIAAGTPFREAAANAVEVRTHELFDLSTEVLDTQDIERVHDMRVATRRLRAVMEIFAPAFPSKPHTRALKEVKALADALGERRDPDVAIHALRNLTASLPAEDAPGIRSLIDEFHAEQEHANLRLSEALDRIAVSNLQQRLLSLAEEARPNVAPAPA
jgi:CHAD domain-containing protein